METRRSEDRFVWKVIKVSGIGVLPFLGYFARYSIASYKTDQQESVNVKQDSQISDLQQRVSRLEQAVTRIPEMDRKIDEILWRVKK